MTPLSLSLHVRIDRAETAPYRLLDLRGHVFSAWIVSHVLIGDVTTQTNGVVARARTGDVMIHPPHLPFDECASGPGTHQWMLFDARESGQALLDRFPLGPVVRLGDRRDEYTATFEAMRRSIEMAPDELRALAAGAHAAALLAQLVGAWRDAGEIARPAALRTPAQRFAPVLAFIDTHLPERLTRTELASVACLHPNAFDRAFSAALGVSPMRLVQRRRAERARLLLETTDDTLDRVASMVGVGDASRLCRLVKAHFGESPGRLKERVKSANARYIPTTDEPVSDLK